MKEGRQKIGDRASLIAQTLMQESDRGCAIFGAAILNDELENLLRACCRTDLPSVKNHIDPLFRTYAPLSTFSARIQVCFALKLIDRETRGELEILRKLRNEFAHESGPIDFSDDRCHDRLKQLITEGKRRTYGVNNSQSTIQFGSHKLNKTQAVDRIAFVIAVAQIAARIEFFTDALRSGKNLPAIVAKFEVKKKEL